MFGWLTRRNDAPEMEGPLAEPGSEVATLQDDLREARRVMNLARDVVEDCDAARADAVSACKLVADMHAAAVGEVRGPIRGVVEDVQDVRAELERFRTVGPCGDVAPTAFNPCVDGTVSAPCILTAGHAGQHAASGGMAWTWGDLEQLTPAERSLALSAERAAKIGAEAARIDRIRENALADEEIRRHAPGADPHPSTPGDTSPEDTADLDPLAQQEAYIATGGIPNPVRVPIPCICGPADDSGDGPCQATTHRACDADLTSDTPKEA